MTMSKEKLEALANASIGYISKPKMYWFDEFHSVSGKVFRLILVWEDTPGYRETEELEYLTGTREEVESLLRERNEKEFGLSPEEQDELFASSLRASTVIGAFREDEVEDEEE